jgi:hypothetical protein
MTTIKDTVPGRRRRGAPNVNDGDKKRRQFDVLLSDNEMKELQRLHKCKGNRLRVTLKQLALDAFWKRNT